MNTIDSIPLVCILPEPQFADRRQLVMETVFASVTEQVELTDGIEFRFSADFPLQTLVDFISAERACCNFFTFELIVAPQSLALRLRGQVGVKAFIMQMLTP